MFKWFFRSQTSAHTSDRSGNTDSKDNRILKQGPALRVVFFYAGEEGTYVDHVPHVTLYENGIVHIMTEHEETTTHLQNCEIIWAFDLKAATQVSPLKLIRKPSAGAAPPVSAEGTANDSTSDAADQPN